LAYRPIIAPDNPAVRMQPLPATAGANARWISDLSPRSPLLALRSDWGGFVLAQIGQLVVMEIKYP
jgi:hypothetical protein